MKPPNARGRQYIDGGYLPDHTMRLHYRWVCAECPPEKIIDDGRGGTIRIALRGSWNSNEEDAMEQLDQHNLEIHA